MPARRSFRARIVLVAILSRKLRSYAAPHAEQKRLAESLTTLVRLRRDAILQAIAISAKELLRSSDLGASLPKIVEQVGQAAGADRLHILLASDKPESAECGRVAHHYVWNAPGIDSSSGFLAIGKSLAEVGLESWIPKLAQGETVVGHSRDFEPAVREFLASGRIKSVLAVPIFVGERWAGIIGFDNCRNERDWSPTDIDIIKILAELVGAAIASTHRLGVLADANRIIENSPTILYRLGSQQPFPLRFLSQNIRRYGYEADHLLAAPALWPDLIEAPDRAVALTNLRAMAAGTLDHDHLEFRFRTPDGDLVWFDGVTTPLRDDCGRLIAFEGILTDITARKLAEQELASSHVLLRAAIENSPEAVLVINQDRQVTAFNRRFVDMWDIPADVLTAPNNEALLRLAASKMTNQAEFLKGVHDLYDAPEKERQDEIETTDGRTIERQSAPLYDSGKAYLGRIWFMRDISKRKTAERKIFEFARVDSLTGLPNRIAFLDRLDLAISRAKRGPYSFAVLYLDLDHFKDVNDTLGHPAGDALLKGVADRLRDCVCDADLVARFGGDEFALLQEDTVDIAGTEALATRICRMIAAPFSIEGNEVHTSASIGVVPYQEDIADPEAMMMKADLALYRAKTEGRDRFCFHIRELDQLVRERVAIREGLHLAIDNGEFELHYQPQVELASGRIVGLEALIRWNHPERGQLLPDQFIPTAESTGSILRIGKWVIEQTCRQIGIWQKKGIAPPVVAANVSAGQFKLDSDLDRMIAQALDENRVDSDRLELELTESVLMEATQRHADEFERLRRIGVRIAIDDFGTGYSSLDYLRSFRVARLKIDRRFVNGVTSNPDDATIVRAVIGLAGELGIEVVAEGVENSEQRGFLFSAGCKFAQGYLFGRPMPVAATTALLLRSAEIANPVRTRPRSVMRPKARRFTKSRRESKSAGSRSRKPAD